MSDPRDDVIRFLWRLLDDIDTHDDAATCCVCERETDLRQGLAVYEDVLVADDAPQPWGGMAACLTCYMAWRSGVIHAGMTFDEAREILWRRLVEAMTWGN